MKQFDRIYKLTCGEVGGQGIVIKNLRISFNIEKDATTSANNARIDIYNLSEETIETLEQPDMICQLEVGYKNGIQLSRIFVGYLAYCSTRQEGADIVTSLELYDGQVPVRDSVFSLGYSNGVNGKKIAQDCAAAMGLTTFFGEDVAFESYPNGYSFAGYARDCLSEICAASNIAWSIQNNVLTFTYDDGGTGLKAFVFNAGSGLIGMPERVVKNAKQFAAEARRISKLKSGKKKKNKSQRITKQSTWRINTLLNPTIGVKDYVKVESQRVNGWFIVESIRFTGDTHGNDWYSSMDLVAGVIEE